MESLNSLKRKLKCNYHLKLPELLLRDLLILAEFLIFSLVDQDNPVSIKECFWEQTLRECRKARLDKGQEDAINSNVISRRAKAGCLATAVDCDWSRDVTNRNTVTVLLNF